MGIVPAKDIRKSHVVSKMVADPGVLDLDALSKGDQQKYFSEHERRLRTLDRYEKRRKIFSKFYDIGDFDQEEIIHNYDDVPNLPKEYLEACKETISQLKLSHHLQWLTNERENLKICLSLYTAPNDFHERINHALRNRVDCEPTKYDKVTKNLILALRCLPYEPRTTYRAHLCTTDECRKYVVGHTITWQTFVSTTLMKEIAGEFFSMLDLDTEEKTSTTRRASDDLDDENVGEGENFENGEETDFYDGHETTVFSNDPHHLEPILFVINGHSGRRITVLSQNQNENEVLYPPDCMFNVDKIEKVDSIVTINLTEVDIIRGRKCLLWVDDLVHKEQNKFIRDVVQQHGVIPIAKRTSESALSFLEDPVNSDVLKSRINKFRIVTDMSRHSEDGSWDNEAGAKFIRTLRREFNYLEPIVVYSKSRKETKARLLKLNIMFNVFITSDSTIASDFASFHCDKNYLENHCYKG